MRISGPKNTKQINKTNNPLEKEAKKLGYDYRTISDKGKEQRELTAEDFAIIKDRVVARVNEEAITTHWEFGVGLAGAIDTPIGELDAGVKLITFNGDFQGGENYAVFGEGSLYARLMYQVLVKLLK